LTGGHTPGKLWAVSNTDSMQTVENLNKLYGTKLENTMQTARYENTNPSSTQA